MKRLFNKNNNKEARNITPLPPNANGSTTFSPPAAYSRYEQEHRQFSNSYPEGAPVNSYSHHEAQSVDPYPSYGSSSEQLGYAGSYPRPSDSGSQDDVYMQTMTFNDLVPRSSEGSLKTPPQVPSTDKQQSHYGSGLSYPMRLQKSDPASNTSSDDDSRRWSLRSKQNNPVHSDTEAHRHRLGWSGRKSKPPLEEEERAQSRNSMLSPDAYPVYAGYGQGNSETLISAGTESNNGHIPTPDKGKKKFFVRGAKKNKEVAPAASGEVGQQQHAWYKKDRKEVDSFITSKIGWLCAQPSSLSDREYLLSLAEEVSHSEAASKEAIRALRKEFKYGSPDAQKRAVRVWAILTMNSSDRFKLQIATKRFLDVVEDTVVSTKTPLSVKKTVLRVLGVLAWEFKGDSELGGVTKCWNKVRPNDRPVDGEPMRPDMEEFAIPQARPLVPPRPQSQYVPPTEYAPPPDRPPPEKWNASPQRPTKEQLHFASPPPEKLQYSSPQTPPQEKVHYAPPPPPSDQYASPAELPARYAPPPPPPESIIARSNAELLIETVITCGLSEETLIAEFYDKVVCSRDTLLVQLEGRNDERTLAQVLDALEKCNEAVKVVDDARVLVKSVSPRSRLLPGPPPLHIPQTNKSSSSSEDIQTPIVPSEKALGKRRALDTLSTLTIE